jgi:hypothetical protein
LKIPLQVEGKHGDICTAQARSETFVRFSGGIFPSRKAQTITVFSSCFYCRYVKALDSTTNCCYSPQLLVSVDHQINALIGRPLRATLSPGNHSHELSRSNFLDEICRGRKKVLFFRGPAKQNERVRERDFHSSQTHTRSNQS